VLKDILGVEVHRILVKLVEILMEHHIQAEIKDTLVELNRISQVELMSILVEGLRILLKQQGCEPM